MRLLKYLRFMTFGLLGSEEELEPSQEKIDAANLAAKPKVIPKGAMYFHFNNRGESVVGLWPLTETVFSCIARTIENADRKYHRWLESENLKTNTNVDSE